MTQLSKADEAAIAQYLSQNLVRPVAIELWTRKPSPLLRSDRDPCTHCEDVVELARQLASLHPGLSLTLYDLDRHAERAAEAGVDREPLTVVRAGGRQLRVLGLWGGPLLAAFVDALIFASARTSPLQEAAREVIGALEQDVTLEALVAPYDPYSVPLMSLVLALGVESPRVRAQATEIAEFPLLAATRGVTELPALMINGRRYSGAWEEADLVEQLRRVAAGDDAPVLRDRAPAIPFLTEDEARRATAGAGEAAAVRSPSGLVLPGQP